MGNIKAFKTDERFFDDGSGIKELKASFKSEVYASFDEYMADMEARARNENFHGELPFVTTSSKPKRTPKERASILLQKIEAERRLELHLEMGGTELSTGNSPRILDGKKASH
ncbi:hypothetical protein L1D41_24695 [Vibrio harveyi]|uniref:hypothetical protein n=1 Tax=Vibrio harveyi TaxID=669 RepID=UPI001EFDFE21|nr:hypothetical protein [Vibrio harveyi]MCG9612840.1 hypothetical protein [Vibrio harveyi]MCG9671317.1 hypothetical protein [Vibrio harveyi]